MQLISEQFIIFFLLSITVLLSSFKWKRIALLLFNVIFYLFSGIHGMCVFLAFSIFTYFSAIIIEKSKNKFVFTLLIILSILSLAFYKYTDFILVEILRLEQLDLLGKISIPLGISFATFQGVGYLVDVYKSKCYAEKNFLNYFVFLSLFTCISSGPINRSEALLSQIREYDNTSFDYSRCVSGLKYILLGLFMKVFIAGCLSPVNPTSFESGLALFIASICYTIMIYCDFCGYSYIAFGISKVIGLDVIQNFKNPYRSKSLTEFWNRWHISLSSWLKDYVYIPLGGSRCSKVRSIFNLIITFFVSGIWHGANWTFIVWGLLNGIIIATERILKVTRDTGKKFVEFLKHIITLIIVNTLWIFFNAPSLESAIYTIKTICQKTGIEIISIRNIYFIKSLAAALGISIDKFIQMFITIFVFLFMEFILRKCNEPIDFFESKHTAVRWIKYFLVIIVVLILGTTGEAGEFIYANF